MFYSLPSIEFTVFEPGTFEAAFAALFGIVVLGVCMYLLWKVRTLEKKSQNVEAFYQQVFDASRDATWDWRIDSNEDFFSPRFAEMLGYSPVEIGHKFSEWEKLIHQEDRKLTDVALKMYFEGKTAYYSHEHRFLAKNGEWRWILGRGKVIEWSTDHKPLRMVGTFTDVSERYQTDAMIYLLIRATSNKTGADYFHCLTRDLCTILGMRWASIGQLVGPNRDRMRTISIHLEGKIIENFEYALAGTPCEQVVRGEPIVISDRVQDLFSVDLDLGRIGAPGYVGLPLISPNGDILGEIVVMDDQPLMNPQFLENVLNIFAGRAAVELDRLVVKQELEESETRWKFALEGTGDGVWDLNFITHEVSYSKAYKNMLGYSEDEIPNRLEAWIHLVHPEDLSFVLQEHERYLRGETEGIFEEYRLKCKDGVYKWILGRGKIIQWTEDGKPLRLVGVITDITMRKASEQFMRETMAKYQSLFGSMTEGFAFHELVFDENGKPVDYIILDVNPSYSALIQIPRDVAIGARASNLYGTGLAPYLDEYSRVALSGIPDHLDIYFAPTNKYFDIAVFSPERGKFATVFMDVTDRMRSAATIAQERNLLRTLIDNLPDAIYTLDLNYRKTLANKADLINAGVNDEAEILGKTDFDVWPHELAARFHEHDRYVIETGRPLLNREEVISALGQSPRWILSSRIPIFDHQGKLSGMVGIGKDITELKMADREIRRLNLELEQRVVERTAQMEAVITELEAFSYSVSHDLRAPLRAMDGFSLALLEEYGNLLDEQGKNFLARIRSASQRMSQLIDDLLKLSRISSSELRREKVDLSGMAASIAAELQANAPDRKVDWLIRPGIEVNGDANFLRIVLVNLFGNSWKFTSKHLSARIELNTTQMEGQLTYYVKDDGDGFNMAYAAKLFGPFQRMHSGSDFEGSGIGLAIVQRVIHCHGGKVWAESSVEIGTTVYFTLGNQE